MPMRKSFRIPGLKPLRTEAERQFDIRQARRAQRHHSDVEFSEDAWRSLQFIRWQLGLRTRSQVVNAALVAYAAQLVAKSVVPESSKSSPEAANTGL